MHKSANYCQTQNLPEISGVYAFFAISIGGNLSGRNLGRAVKLSSRVPEPLRITLQ